MMSFSEAPNCDITFSGLFCQCELPSTVCCPGGSVQPSLCPRAAEPARDAPGFLIWSVCGTQPWGRRQTILGRGSSGREKGSLAFSLAQSLNTVKSYDTTRAKRHKKYFSEAKAENLCRLYFCMRQNHVILRRGACHFSLNYEVK